MKGKIAFLVSGILLVGCLLPAKNLTYTQNGDWKCTEAVVCYTDSPSGERAALYLTPDYHLSVGMFIDDDSCALNDRSGNGHEWTMVNDRTIKTYTWCIESGSGFLSPDSVYDSAYVVNEFKEKDSVTIEGIKFSTNGFNWAFKNLMNKMENK